MTRWIYLMEHNMYTVLIDHLGVVLAVFRGCKKDCKSNCANKGEKSKLHVGKQTRRKSVLKVTWVTILFSSSIFRCSTELMSRENIELVLYCPDCVPLYDTLWFAKSDTYLLNLFYTPVGSCLERVTPQILFYFTLFDESFYTRSKSLFDGK